eukprot:TRINITY_DN4494_c4_g1_i1.p1 TRINITY_DN4494_c4_g1~~TRINITY_DN4494_c4_g1_i1.p1  ORF type:complete len:391 (-),score=101.74 TRINITY_DN4494_c4_g1_i1:238-1410(-)
MASSLSLRKDEKLSAFNDAFELSDKRSSDLTTKAKELRVSIKTAERNIQSLVKDIATYKKSIKEASSELSKLKPKGKKEKLTAPSSSSSSSSSEKNSNNHTDINNSNTDVNVLDHTTYRKYADEIKAMERGAEALHEEFAPMSGSLFVKIFLGRVNVKQYGDTSRYSLKSEYERFKRKSTMQFIALVLLQLFVFPENKFLGYVFQIWTLWYYVTLALRENILRVNGSRIRQWWITHHYLSIGIAFTIITWSDTPSFAQFLGHFLYFCLAQCLVQTLLNNYQQGRLYQLVAMGRANRIAVAAEGETFCTAPGFMPSLALLLPCLLFVQGFALYISFLLFSLIYDHGGVVEWQTYAMGFLFFSIGSGNLITTVQTYYAKYKKEGGKMHMDQD